MGGPDTIRIDALSIHLLGAGPSAFGLIPPPACPLELSLDLELHPSVVPHSVEEDAMAGLGVNYSTVAKAVYAALDRVAFSSPAAILDAAAAVPLSLPAVRSVGVSARLPRALLHADTVYARTYTDTSRIPRATTVPVTRRSVLSLTTANIRAATVVGLHPHEREKKQRLEVDVTVRGAEDDSHHTLSDTALDFLETTSFGTLESLVDTLARHLLLSLPPTASVELKVRKPSALPFAIPVISLTRSRASYASRGGITAEAVATACARAFSSAAASSSSLSAPAPVPAPAEPPRVFIAVGSNIGDRVGNIRRGLRLLQEGGCTLIDTSRLYESEPMYVTDQDIFTNGVIELSTPLAPIDLLRLLKRTESEVGRTKTYRNGPRVLDLDLVAYGDSTVSIGEPGDAPDADGVAWLRIPHASVAEREFVLRPLADIDSGLVLPGVGRVDTLLANVAPGGLAPIIPFPAPAQPLRLAEPGGPATPAIMAIFNATPDSFSDGAVERTRACTALARAEDVLTVKPAILDIGGMSTRPGSEPCSEDEELARVVPLITTLRGAGHILPISVDTYRPSVAIAAMDAGASCINDVRSGREAGMYAAMAKADAPVVLMHSRGDSTTMLSPEAHIYPNGVVADVAAELLASADAARAIGVKRWDIVLNPGLGFAKSQNQNLALLRNLPQLAERLRGYGLLVGASRKGFVGAVSGISTAAERGPADAAINSVCTASGVVDVLRVHAPAEAAATVRMAAAIRDAEE